MKVDLREAQLELEEAKETETDIHNLIWYGTDDREIVMQLEKEMVKDQDRYLREVSKDQDQYLQELIDDWSYDDGTPIGRVSSDWDIDEY